MADIKTKVTTVKVKDFLVQVLDDRKRADALTLLNMFEKVTGEKAKMWGTSIVGFGAYHYQSEKSSQQGDWPLTAVSPRKQNLTLYLMLGTSNFTELLKKLGKHKVSGGSCLYINKLSDVDGKVLEKLIKESFLAMKKKYQKSLVKV